MQATRSWFSQILGRGVLVSILGGLLGSCGGGETPSGPSNEVPTQTLSSIAVTPGTDTLWAIGRTRTFTAQPKDASGNPMTGVSIQWKSTNPGVATVDASTGVVTAVNNGTASIQAISGTVLGEAALAVSQVVATVTVAPGTAGLTAVGEARGFNATAKDSAGASVNGVRFLWISSNPGVATIDTTGLLIATGAGTATISATGRGIPGYANVSVMQSPAHLAFTIQPVNAVAGGAISPAVQVEIQDSHGVVVPTARQAVTIGLQLNPGPGHLAGTTTVNAVGGIATFSGLWLDKAANGYALSASASGLTGMVSSTFNIASSVATQLVYLTQPPASDLVFAPVSARVAFRDAFGNAVADTEITSVGLHTKPWGDAQLQVGSVTTPNPGERQLENIQVDRPGSGYSLEVRSGTMVAVSDPFKATADFGSFGVGSNQACAVADRGTFCWGYNASGALGVSTLVAQQDSVPRLVPGGHDFIKVQTGYDTSCGIDTGGAVWCWGISFSPTPTKVAGTGTLTTFFSDIAISQTHACGLTTINTIYCWGENGFGALGDSTNTTSTTIPVLVSGSGAGSRVFNSVAVGYHFSCASTVAEAVYCWGFNTAGQLGNSTFNSSIVPVQVTGSGATDVLFDHVTAGLTHACGFKAGTFAYCWGNNEDGQLGDGSISLAENEPTRVIVAGIGYGFTDIAAGTNHTCAIDNGATLCWGKNNAGQLGTGFIGNQRNPVSLGFTFSATAIHAGGDETCASTATGLFCWGSNQSGQLGIGSMTTSAAPFPVRIVQ